MPSNPQRLKDINKCRWLIRNILGLPEGCQSLTEKLVMICSRRAFAALTDDERGVVSTLDSTTDIIVALPTLAAEVVQAAWRELLDNGSLSQWPTMAIPLAIPPDPAVAMAPLRDLCKKAFDKYLMVHHVELRAAAESELGSDVCKMDLNSKAKKLGWRRWSSLGPDAQQFYRDMVSQPGCRIRVLGKFVHKPITDASSLAELAALAMDVSPMPKKFKLMGLPTPSKDRKQLAAIGSAFIEVMSGVQEQHSNFASRGIAHGMQMVCTDVVLKSGVSSRAKAIKGLKLVKTKLKKGILSGNSIVNPKVNGKRENNLPCRRPKMSDRELVEALQPFTQSARKFSDRAATPMRLMTCALKDGFRRMDSKLRKKISYSRLCRRVRIRNPALGIGKATKAVDLCIECRCFDAVMKPKLYKMVADIRELEHLLPGYLEKFDEQTTPIADDFAHVDYLPKLVAYVRETSVETCAARSALSPCQAEALGLREALALDLADPVVKDLGEFCGHFSLRDHIHDVVADNKSNPAPRTLYIMSDWED
jgi:hypothetical protein